MSINHMNDVWKYSEAKGITKFVLIAIADNADADYGEAYPGVPYLAKKTGLGERTIRQHVRKLVDLEELEILQRGGYRGGVAKANLYRVTVGAKRHLTPVDSEGFESEAADHADEQADHDIPYRRETAHEQAGYAPQPEEEPSVKETEEETKKDVDDFSSEFYNFIVKCRVWLDGEEPENSGQVQEEFHSRLDEGFTDEQLLSAFRGAQAVGDDDLMDVLHPHRIKDYMVTDPMKQPWRRRAVA